jgi:hypothetical protein
MAGELLQTIGSFVGYAVVGGVVYSLKLAQDWLEKKRKIQNIDATVNNNLKVYELLSEIRQIFGADRVKLFQFKNGDYFAGGGSEQKLTMSHIVCRTGVSIPAAAMTDYQLIPVGMMTKFLDALGRQSWKDFIVRGLEDDFYFKYPMLRDGTEHIVATLIKSNGRTLGLLIVSWLEETKINDRDLAEAKTLTETLGAIITVKK